jgi:hypothetical protein
VNEEVARLPSRESQRDWQVDAGTHARIRTHRHVGGREDAWRRPRAHIPERPAIGGERPGDFPRSPRPASARASLAGFFMDVWSRETAGGVKDAPLIKATATRSLRPDRLLFITDTAEGLQTGKRVGLNAILMMNDPNEAMKLTAHEPAGGIVSLHELPDFVRLVAAENARSGSLQRG